MDDRTNESYEEVLAKMRNEIKLIKSKCQKAQEDLEKKVSHISRLDKDITETEYGLSRYKSKIESLENARLNIDVKIDEQKWVREKVGIILESTMKKNIHHDETMDVIKRNYMEITSSSLKTRRQETVREIISVEINNLSARKVELENKLEELRAIKTENENKLAQANEESRTIKDQMTVLRRLEVKLRESESIRNRRLVKLNELKENLNPGYQMIVKKCDEMKDTL